ncbi:MAG: sodium:proton antiporter [Gemmatimonadales bacterium]
MPATQDPISQAIVAAVLLASLVLLTLEKAHRLLVILSAAAVLWLLTYLTPYHLISFEGAQRALDLNVILLLASMMAIVGVLKTTGAFGWAAARLVDRARGVPGALQARIVWFTGVLSAFVDNVTTVLFMYPMATRMAATTGIAAAALLMPMIVASNIGGTATLIGDPPNILIGSAAGLSFMEFLINLAMPVAWMLVAGSLLSRRYYRLALKRKSPAETSLAPTEVPTITDPLLLKWGLAIAALVLLGFLTHAATGMPAAVPAVIGGAALLVVQDVLYLRRRAATPTPQERTHGILAIIEREIEWPTLAFFAFLFIAVGAAVDTGLIDTLARGLVGLVESGRHTLELTETGTLLFASLLILWVSGVLSALIDNIPYVAVTIPLVARLAESLSGEVQVLWWALSLGACLGGNGTAIGASANVTVIGLADRAGQHISFREFTRFGATITGVTLLISSAFLASFVWFGPNLTRIVGLAGLVGYGLWRLVATRRS